MNNVEPDSYLVQQLDSLDRRKVLLYSTDAPKKLRP
jgi:hypothetical protein